MSQTNTFILDILRKAWDTAKEPSKYSIAAPKQLKNLWGMMANGPMEGPADLEDKSTKITTNILESL